jgi:hypothetical protein
MPLKFMNPYLLNLTLNKLIRVFTVACLAAVLFISCEQSNGEIGSGKFSDNRPELGEKLSYPVVSYTTSWDSISTKSPSRVVLGNLNDPIFGAVSSSFSTRILLSKSSPDFGAGTICDSVKVRIGYVGYYGVTGDNIRLEVSPLLEPLVDSLPYYSNHAFSVGSALVDTVLKVAPSDTVYNGVDTLVGYLAFDLDPSYFQTEIFDAAITGETYLADNVDFVQEVAGLHFKDIGPGSSAACYFDLSAPGSIIQLYYHTGVEDTVPKVFNMTFGQNFGDPVGSFNSFAHDFSGADFDLGMMDTLNGEIRTYIQGGSGARTMLVFPGLDTLIGKGYSINRAELNFNVVQGTASPYTLPGTLLLVQGTDSAQQLIKDYSSSLSNVGGSVTRADIRSYKYRFNVTRMVHDFVNTKEEILPVMIAPSGANANLHRVVLGGGLHPVIPAEFNVYYTKSE